MKTRINLFSKKRQTQPIPVQAYRLRNYGILTVIISVLICMGAGGFYWYQLQELNRLTAEVQRTKQIVAASNDVQGDVVFFVNKKDQLNTFLQDDIDFAIYFRLLQSIIADAGVEAELVSMNLEPSLESNFIIAIGSFEDGESLMSFIESESFLQYFESLTMNSFRIGLSDRLELQFRGQFVDQTDDQLESGETSPTESEDGTE